MAVVQTLNSSAFYKYNYESNAQPTTNNNSNAPKGLFDILEFHVAIAGLRAQHCIDNYAAMITEVAAAVRFEGRRGKNVRTE